MYKGDYHDIKKEMDELRELFYYCGCTPCRDTINNIKRHIKLYDVFDSVRDDTEGI